MRPFSEKKMNPDKVPFNSKLSASTKLCSYKEKCMSKQKGPDQPAQISLLQEEQSYQVLFLCILQVTLDDTQSS